MSDWKGLSEAYLAAVEEESPERARSRWWRLGAAAAAAGLALVGCGGTDGPELSPGTVADADGDGDVDALDHTATATATNGATATATATATGGDGPDTRTTGADTTGGNR